MYFLVFYLFGYLLNICYSSTTDRHNASISKVDKMAANAAKLINIVQNVGEFESNYPKIGKKGDEKEKINNENLLLTMQLLQKNYDASRKANDEFKRNPTRVFVIRNPEVLDQYKKALDKKENEHKPKERIRNFKDVLNKHRLKVHYLKNPEVLENYRNHILDRRGSRKSHTSDSNDSSDSSSDSEDYSDTDSDFRRNIVKNSAIQIEELKDITLKSEETYDIVKPFIEKVLHTFKEDNSPLKAFAGRALDETEMKENGDIVITLPEKYWYEEKLNNNEHVKQHNYNGNENKDTKSSRFKRIENRKDISDDIVFEQDANVWENQGFRYDKESDLTNPDNVYFVDNVDRKERNLNIFDEIIKDAEENVYEDGDNRFKYKDDSFKKGDQNGKINIGNKYDVNSIEATTLRHIVDLQSVKDKIKKSKLAYDKANQNPKKTDLLKQQNESTESAEKAVKSWNKPDDVLMTAKRKTDNKRYEDVNSSKNDKWEHVNSQNRREKNDNWNNQNDNYQNRDNWNSNNNNRNISDLNKKDNWQTLRESKNTDIRYIKDDYDYRDNKNKNQDHWDEINLEGKNIDWSREEISSLKHDQRKDKNIWDQKHFDWDEKDLNEDISNKGTKWNNKNNDWTKKDSNIRKDSYNQKRDNIRDEPKTNQETEWGNYNAAFKNIEKDTENKKLSNNNWDRKRPINDKNQNKNIENKSISNEWNKNRNIENRKPIDDNWDRKLPNNDWASKVDVKYPRNPTNNRNEKPDYTINKKKQIELQESINDRNKRIYKVDSYERPRKPQKHLAYDRNSPFGRTPIPFRGKRPVYAD